MPTTKPNAQTRRRRHQGIAELLGLDPGQTSDIQVERGPTAQTRLRIAQRMRNDPTAARAGCAT